MKLRITSLLVVQCVIISLLLIVRIRAADLDMTYNRLNDRARLSDTVKLDPDSQVVIRTLADDVTTISGPFERFGKVKIGSRSTIVQLPSGGLAVFSPVPRSRAVISEIGQRKVSYLIALDVEHHLYLQEWALAYPEANIIGMEELVKKRLELNKKNPSMIIPKWTTIFTAHNKHLIKISPEFDEVFDYEFMEAHVNKELVFYHRPSKTLIQADLLWNLPVIEQYSLVQDRPSYSSRFYSKLADKMLNTKDNALGQKLLSWHIFSTNKKSYNASIRRINSWGFINIIPCHGEVIRVNGKKVFENVMSWHLRGYSIFSVDKLRTFRD